MMGIKNSKINKISRELSNELRKLSEEQIDRLLNAIGFSTKEVYGRIVEFEDKIGVLINEGEGKLRKILGENKEKKSKKVRVENKEKPMKVENKVKAYLEKIKREDKKINAFLHLNDNVISEAREIDKKAKKGRLYGYVFGIKSNINVKGMICNCASKTLENYKAPYDATVIEKIRKEDGIIIGMCNMDEFAAGSSGENSAFGATENPTAFGRIPGGSSSGSAAAVAAGFCDVAL